MSLPKLHSHHTSSFGTSSRSRANPEPHFNRVTAANRYTVSTSLSSSPGVHNWLNKTVDVYPDSDGIRRKASLDDFEIRSQTGPESSPSTPYIHDFFPSVLSFSHFPDEKLQILRLLCYDWNFWRAGDFSWVTLSFQVCLCYSVKTFKCPQSSSLSTSQPKTAKG